MKKEDIILKKGDKVYYALPEGMESFLIIDASAGSTIKEFEEADGVVVKITKIERPEYETIYEAPKTILNKEEKEYLEAVLRPFRNEINHIEKTSDAIKEEYLYFDMIDEYWYLPNFKKGTMYKGMVAGKRYTLAELGLFEGE